ERLPRAWVAVDDDQQTELLRCDADIGELILDRTEDGEIRRAQLAPEQPMQNPLIKRPGSGVLCIPVIEHHNLKLLIINRLVTNQRQRKSHSVIVHTIDRSRAGSRRSPGHAWPSAMLSAKVLISQQQHTRIFTNGTL